MAPVGKARSCAHPHRVADPEGEAIYSKVPNPKVDVLKDDELIQTD